MLVGLWLRSSHGSDGVEGYQRLRQSMLYWVNAWRETFFIHNILGVTHPYLDNQGRGGGTLRGQHDDIFALEARWYPTPLLEGSCCRRNHQDHP